MEIMVGNAFQRMMANTSTGSKKTGTKKEKERRQQQLKEGKRNRGESWESVRDVIIKIVFYTSYHTKYNKNTLYHIRSVFQYIYNNIYEVYTFVIYMRVREIIRT